MKKQLLVVLIISIGLTAFFASCLKDNVTEQTPAQPENTVSSNDGVSDRSCSQTVTMYGVLGLALCGNAAYYPGSVCYDCGSSYGRVAIEFDVFTTTMLGTTFTLINPTAVTKYVSFSVSGNCASLVYAIPPGTYKSFEIYQANKGCCTVRATECE